MIRKYNPIADYAAVLAIYKSSFGPEFTEELLRFHMQRSSKHAWVYEMKHNGEMIGYILTEMKEGEVYLTQVAVLLEHRGYGIATKLIHTAENDHAPFHDIMWLQVQSDNPAQKLYFDLGYRVTKVEKDLYAPGKNGLRMEKVL